MSDRSSNNPEPSDPRNPSEEFVYREIEQNRLAEYWLVPKALLALVIVAALVVVRQLFLR